MQDRTETIRKINTMQVSKTDLAALAGLDPSRISQYVRNRKLPGDQAARIEAAVDEVSFVWSALAPFKISTADPVLFREAVQQLKRVLGKLGGEHAPLESLAVASFAASREIETVNS